MLDRLNGYPVKMHWFAASEPEVALRRRATIAAEILAHLAPLASSPEESEESYRLGGSINAALMDTQTGPARKQ